PSAIDVYKELESWSIDLTIFQAGDDVISKLPLNLQNNAHSKYTSQFHIIPSIQVNFTLSNPCFTVLS
ncbi:23049_t:CDS:1, partial [Gigaspora margarita]